MLASATSLKPFLRPFHTGYVFSTADVKGSGYSTAGTNSRGNAYYMLSTAKFTTDNDGGVVQTKKDEEVEGHADQEDVARLPTSLPRAHRAGHPSQRIKTREHGRTDSEQMIISKTEEWTVTYEDDQQRVAGKAV